jgi:hypothetical protein
MGEGGSAPTEVGAEATNLHGILTFVRMMGNRHCETRSVVAVPKRFEEIASSLAAPLNDKYVCHPELACPYRRGVSGAHGILKKAQNDGQQYY